MPLVLEVERLKTEKMISEQLSELIALMRDIRRELEKLNRELKRKY